MATEQITTPSRRGAFKQIASMAAATIVAARTAQADPVALLGERWRELYAIADRCVAKTDKTILDGTDDEAAAAFAAQNAAWDRVKAVEQQMLSMVATTPAGVAAQARLLRDFVSVSEYEPLIDNMLAGLAKLPGTVV